MLKSPKELEAMDEADTNITKKGSIDYYADRPDELEDLCLADFIANFNFSKTGKGQTAEEENDDD